MESEKLTLDFELQNYLTMGGFPLGFTSTKEIMYRKLVDVITRIVTQDLSSIANYEVNSNQHIMRIIGAIATKRSGELSITKLANSLNLSPTKVSEILDWLQKAHLILSVKPYPVTRNPASLSKVFKYYFMSPTLLSAILYLNGIPTATNQEKAMIWESAVASSIFKLCHTSGSVYNLFYDPRKETNVDFLLQNPLGGTTIPIECGLNKDTSQIRSAIEEYKSSHGIVITESSEVSLQDNIIKIPFWLFLYI